MKCSLRSAATIRIISIVAVISGSILVSGVAIGQQAIAKQVDLIDRSLKGHPDGASTVNKLDATSNVLVTPLYVLGIAAILFGVSAFFFSRRCGVAVPQTTKQNAQQVGGSDLGQRAG